MTHYRMLDREPSAIITVAGSERKIYQDGQIFLNNGDNFEIRFFNPLSVKVGVEIVFDGVKKNNGYLVLNPGEDVTLDRFLNEKKRMLFETYHIDSSNPDAVAAVSNNGLIHINFYKEKSYTRYSSYNYNRRYCSSIDYKTMSNVCGMDMINHQSYVAENLENTLSDSNTVGPKGVKGPKDSRGKTGSKLKSKLETGRIERGENSLQEMKSVDVEFEHSPFHTIIYKLRPISQLSEQVNEIRQYCPNCSYRIRKSSWNYCPKCCERL